MSNQYLRDSVLFKAGMGWPITELSIRGDRLCLYTEDTYLYRRFRQWRLKISEQRYWQQVRGSPDKLVGVDIYFPLSARGKLLPALKRQVLAAAKPGV